MSNFQENYVQGNLGQTVSETDPFTLERYVQFYRYFQPGAVSVLDVGCNTGRGGQKLAELDSKLQIHGLDCVQDRLDQLPACYYKRTCGFTQNLPYEDRMFDVIVAGEFLEHLYPAHVDPTLCEFQRVLKVGGRLLLTTPNPRYIRMKLQRSTVYQDSHLTQHFPGLLKKRLMMHGFSNVRIRGSGKVSRYLGYHFPFLPIYGSFLIAADKY
jgi:ubiquinone/menaquinone biosynthesis C-methylase UbiE